MASSLGAERVSVTFGGLQALDKVSLSATPGEVLGIIGPNGAGKTTLFNVMCGFIRPTSGRILLDGMAIAPRPDRLSGLGIARTLQGVGLWPGMTVVDNVMIGTRARIRRGFVPALLGLPSTARGDRQAREAAMDALSALGVADVAGRLPPTLPYPVQKKVALARALVAEPSFLLLDEPASGLSTGDMDELAALIRSLAPRMGILLVEHHMDLVMSVCDRIVVLNFGAVIATGAPAEVQADPDVTAAYLGQTVAQEDVQSLVASIGEDDA